jgi:hypothetical protein
MAARTQATPSRALGLLDVWDTGAAAATADVAALVVAAVGLRGTGRAPVSASANSRAVGHRSAGNFSSAHSTAAATCSGTDGRLARMLRGRSVSTREMIACDVVPTCGGSPVSIS